MAINEKTKFFFVINGEDCNKLCLTSEGKSVNYATRYLYFGAWFIDSAKMDEILKLHEASSEAVLYKFFIFCASNTQMPFIYKKAVFEAAVMSSLQFRNLVKGKNKSTGKTI